MKRSSRPVRTAADLPHSVHRQLNSYVLAAGAAGVGMLALAQPVEGKIVYTPAHEKLTLHQGLSLDLDHNGTRDFVLAFGSRAETGFRSGYAIVYGWGYSNGAIATAKGDFTQAVALRAGSRIGLGRSFKKGADYLVREVYNYGKGVHSTKWYGPWGNGGKGLKDRYLGLKFFIHGKVHFGWARVTVTTTAKTFTPILTGYAYETIPNKSIRAGQTKGTDEIATNMGTPVSPATLPTPESATLGLLAKGSAGLSIWRRQESRIEAR